MDNWKIFGLVTGVVGLIADAIALVLFLRQGISRVDLAAITAVVLAYALFYLDALMVWYLVEHDKLKSASFWEAFIAQGFIVAPFFFAPFIGLWFRVFVTDQYFIIVLASLIIAEILGVVWTFITMTVQVVMNWPGAW